MRKLAESITFRGEADGTPSCGPNAGNADATYAPWSLEMYYSEPYRTGGEEYHNRPFSRFNVRGDITWKDETLSGYGGYTLKLNDVAGDDGAAKLVIKPGWLVRLKIGIKTGYSSLGNEVNDVVLNEMIDDKSDNPNIIRVDDEASDAGYFYIIVLLDGDEGDYVSIDLDDEHGDIGQFVIKAGGTSYSEGGKLDNNANDQSVRIELLGVSFKSCFTNDDEDDGDNGTDDDTDGGTDDDTDDDATCVINDDCAEGEICESGTCVEKIEGCTDPRSNEYDSSANVENGTCISCETGYEKDSNGLCTVCADGYTADAAGTCYEDEDEEEAFPWLYVAGIGAALVLVLS
tara:strand:- start:2343 stop:3380 length:1038 start_codon:yes stop_codon:yes gene_type:complete